MPTSARNSLSAPAAAEEGDDGPSAAAPAPLPHVTDLSKVTLGDASSGTDGAASRDPPAAEISSRTEENAADEPAASEVEAARLAQADDVDDSRQRKSTVDGWLKEVMHHSDPTAKLRPDAPSPGAADKYAMVAPAKDPANNPPKAPSPEAPLPPPAAPSVAPPKPPPKPPPATPPAAPLPPPKATPAPPKAAEAARPAEPAVAMPRKQPAATSREETSAHQLPGMIRSYEVVDAP